ncbi:hypothetical protein HF521_001867 [Silurus meridionalis]|uniref:Endonuclease/exonuclease/phosphatase domain-containing protein n=1 Tax=Silurus meridionalis TaxID=175797 RepID=A0A8T0BC63_SILME|nr:hypothetical protein HF521_001867 [Silurus meridionalis]
MEEWRRSVLVPIFKNKGDVQTCSNYRGIKLISHTMKLWERVVEARLREEVTICEQKESVRQEELWYCMRKSGVSEKNVRVVQDMYEDSVTAVKCAVGTTDWFKLLEASEEAAVGWCGRTWALYRKRSELDEVVDGVPRKERLVIGADFNGHVGEGTEVMRR